jgi:hypothetical protein
MAASQQNDQTEPASAGLARAARRSPGRARWLFLVIALILLAPLLAVLGLTVGVFGVRDEAGQLVPGPADSDPPASSQVAQEPSERPAGALMTWRLSSSGTDMYTVEVGAAGTGPLRVLEDATAVGTYAWSGSTLTIDFRRTLTMTDGVAFEDPWRFECSGAPTDATLSCVGTSYAWSYHPVDGLDPGQPADFDAVATRG